LVLSTKRLVAAAKVLVAATKIITVVPNFVAVTKPFFPIFFRVRQKLHLKKQPEMRVNPSIQSRHRTNQNRYQTRA